MTDLSIIIVTFNNEGTIGSCLKSISEKIKSNYQIIVVDNNSQDKTVQEIKKSNIAVELIQQSENLGFSKGNNIGVKKALAKLFFFLNPDTLIVDLDIERIVRMIEEEKVGIVAPKLMLKNGTPQPSVTNFPTHTRAILEYWFGFKNSYRQYVPVSDKPIEIEAVYGAALFIKSEIFESAGRFDEKYFVYFEDLSLCKKIHQLGLKIIYDPLSIVEHAVGSSSKTNPLTNKLFIQSAKVYHGIIGYFVLYLILRFRIYK